ncbi:hypothetical protein [Streptosporangium sp. KLBMP 9127]|nr:hypothetical protein [Streptosporangium sp. KLBMP 9127]
MTASNGHPPATKPPGGSSKASKMVTLTVLGVVSMMVVSACARSDDEINADCVDLDTVQPDGSYTVIDEDYCDDDRYHGSHGAYSWYYGGVRNGARVVSGTTVRPSDVRITSRTGSVIQRGGFGSRGSGGG